MKDIIKKSARDKPLLTGIGLVAFSVLLYTISDQMKLQRNGVFSPLFFLHYGLALGYAVYLIFSCGKRFFFLFNEKVRAYHLLLLMLFNISAFALNRTLPIFNESATWLIVFLVAENILLLVYCIIPTPSKAIASLFLFIFGISLCFHLYQTFMVVPYWSIGLIAFFFFGISLHILVPLFYLLGLYSVSKHLLSQYKTRKGFLIAGIVISVLILGIYTYQWHQLNESITQVKHQMHRATSSSQLPEWVVLAQRIPLNTFTELAIKSGIVYQEFTNWDSFFGTGLRFEDQQFHDPLVAIATLLVGQINLDEETRLKLLNAHYDQRHETSDRFWTGLDLQTKDIINNIQCFPSFRIAYTEMLLSIKNNSTSRWSQQEAIYTFQLPEGGVVTSLSLWIEGQEEKARLTTKAKAERAYNTIVGREARDPSIVYWMEGNSIRVRVFPCTSAEDRQFKIGITSPLALEKDKLVYEPITFKGPAYDQASVSINLHIGKENTISYSSLPLTSSEEWHSWSGSYQQNWKVEIKAPKLSSSAFQFNNTYYAVREWKPMYEDFNPQVVYLDINNTWTAEEIEQITQLFAGQKLIVFNDQFQEQDFHATKNDSSEFPSFTLFPFYKITSLEETLVITKGNVFTPNLSDLEKTEFKQKLFNWFAHQSQSVKVFDLASEPSNFMQSLEQFGVVSIAQGNVNQLKQLLDQQHFPVEQNNEGQTILSSAKIAIQMTVQATHTAAPDHLLRLFAYNSILKDIGRNYFKQAYQEEEVIQKAALANVVTPVSSLIVLETQKDYERFEVDENKDSLSNAKIDSSGAVPEPHEWLMIVAGAIISIWIGFKRRVFFQR